MKCKDCKYLQADITLGDEKNSVAALYGKNVHPCNRYPMNILRHPKEQACGEFKPRTKLN